MAITTTLGDIVRNIENLQEFKIDRVVQTGNILQFYAGTQEVAKVEIKFESQIDDTANWDSTTKTYSVNKIRELDSTTNQRIDNLDIPDMDVVIDDFAPPTSANRIYSVKKVNELVDDINDRIDEAGDNNPPIIKGNGTSSMIMNSNANTKVFTSNSNSIGNKNIISRGFPFKVVSTSEKTITIETYSGYGEDLTEVGIGKEIHFFTRNSISESQGYQGSSVVTKVIDKVITFKDTVPSGITEVLVDIGEDPLDVIGVCSNVLGSLNIVTGKSSVATGNRNIVRGDYSSVLGDNNVVLGDCATSNGRLCRSSGDYSNSEGYSCVSSGVASHTEGYRNQSSGVGAHAEGESNSAGGNASHAEGYKNVTVGEYSHAEGCNNMAIGKSSHAGGDGCKSHGNMSTAVGVGMEIHSLGGFAIGRNGEVSTDNSATVEVQTDDAFVIGNGLSSENVKSNCFRVAFDGSVHGMESFNSTGADYSEYFEWEDGNENNDDRVGMFVTTSGDKITIASEEDYILGVVSATPSVVGNSWDNWKGMYIRDDWGRVVLHEEVLEDGSVVRVPVINPEYNRDTKYVSRQHRKEWSPIGMLGKLLVRDNGLCEVNSWCTCCGGIAVPGDSSGYRVIRRVTDNIIEIIFR